jgi:prephenate dehydrogenase
MFDTVCIAGLGRRGTALGLALGQRGLARRRVGWDAQMQRAQDALEAGALDEVTVFPQDEVAAADLLVVAAPTEAVHKVARVYGRGLPDDALLVDLRTSKDDLEALRAHLPRGRHVVGCAPLTSLERLRQRPDAAYYQNTTCLIAARDPEGAPAKRVAALWSALGAVPMLVQEHRHDMVAAALYHAPLALQATAWLALQELGEAAPQLAPQAQPWTGLRALLEENRGATLAVLGRHHSVLKDLLGWMERQQWEQLTQNWPEDR